MKNLFRYRNQIQAAATVFTNAHLTGFFKGSIYTGAGKQFCVPGLNCYSCPGALGSCPIGALQAVAAGNRHGFSFYAAGTLIFFGVLFGRLICGFLCPFGWIQQLLHKIPLPKLHIAKTVDQKLRLLKYLILALFVLALPAFVADGFGLGLPWFCKWICPVGTLEGGIPLVLTDESLRSGLGFTFFWKLFLLATALIGSTLIYRPFCKYICPLGAIYALFNRFSMARMELNSSNCISCRKCEKICPMQVEVTKNINSAECIRCGKCAHICPTGAIDLKFGKIVLQKNAISPEKENDT